jgi:hypothetical protein
MEIIIVDKVFNELWKSGHRFIDERDKKSIDYGIYQIQDGKVEGFTINGLKKHVNLKIDGKPLSDKEIEMMFNYGKFMRTLK